MRIHWILGAAVVASGCNQAFGIKTTEIADAIIDRDHDGIADSKDDCPDVSDPLQHDEDGDGLGDACDPCPGNPASPTDKDTDSDGIPDVCDPHPMTAGDCLAWFDSFTALDPSWQITGTPPVVSNGVAHLAGDVVMSGGGGAAVYGVSFQASAVTYTATDAYIEIFEGRSAPGKGYECRKWLDPAYQDPDPNLGQLTLEAFAIGSVDGYWQLIPRPPNTTVGFRFVRTPDRECWLTPNPIAYTPTLGTMTGGPPSVGLPGIDLHAGTADVAWFAAYTFQSGANCALAVVR